MFGVILLAGGKGLRFGGDCPKQFLTLAGRPLFAYSLEIFLRSQEISELVIVSEASYHGLFEEEMKRHDLAGKSYCYARPGERRQDSVYHGLKQISQGASYVCVHDAARPLLRAEALSQLLRSTREVGAAALGVPLKFTVKECGESGRVLRTPAREYLWEIQTPQAARRDWMEEGFDKVYREGTTVTDDVSLVELLGYPVQIVTGETSNLKITTQEDLLLAEQLMSRRI